MQGPFRSTGRRPTTSATPSTGPTSSVSGSSATSTKRIAALEGGAAAQTLSSGTAAIFFTITNIARAGDEVVAASNLYGGTFSQFDAILPNAGIKVNFTPVNDFGAVEAAINEKTRLLFIEAVGNPALDIADIEKYAEVAHRHHLPLVVDATFTPPPLGLAGTAPASAVS